MKLHVGTSGFGYKEWKGSFYPEDIPQKEMLHFYGERMKAVEINYTFYHMPTEKVLTPWAAQVPEDFVFAFKAPMVITHVKRLKDVGEEAEYFFRTLSLLGSRFGAVLLQFPGNFKVNRPRLEEFLLLIPKRVDCAFEFRNPTWLEEGVPDLLRRRGHCLCVSDDDAAPAGGITETSSWGYLRLRRSGYGEEDLARWADIVLAQKWEKTFVFFKHEEEGKGPREALKFLELAKTHEPLSIRQGET
jgi:uncharacterized protein YecE (DUF72 family)